MSMQGIKFAFDNNSDGGTDQKQDDSSVRRQICNIMLPKAKILCTRTRVTEIQIIGVSFRADYGQSVCLLLYYTLFLLPDTTTCA